MKTACLILAYGAAPVLRVTVPLLKAAGWDVFVHVDPKAGQDRYVTAMGDTASSCRFVEDATEVFWGGYTMIKAQLKLMETARAAGPYDKYILLSDDSFPALPPPVLDHHFENEEDQITIQRQGESSPFLARYKGFYCYDHEATSPRALARPGHNLVFRPIDQTLEHKVAEIAVLRRNGKKIIDLYYGSQFWALTAKSVDLILDVVLNDLHLVKSFEYSALPDETMFQSILGHYVYGSRLETGPVYVDFSGGGPRMIGRTEDLPRDLQQPHAFVRKLSPADPAFLEELARRLEAGLTINGTSAELPQIVHQSIDERGRAHVTMRLSAPPDNAGPSWHPIESYWGRRYRWTASQSVKFSTTTDIILPGTVRFVITIVIASGSAWMEDCQLAFAGITRPLRLENGELVAEFDHLGLETVEAELITPPLTSPSETVGSHDTRHLGLCVAL